MADCTMCERIKSEGTGLWFCPYKSTYYMNSVYITRKDVMCEGFKMKMEDENGWAFSNDELRTIARKVRLLGTQEAKAMRRKVETPCLGCGKVVTMRLSECYCPECREKETAKDNEKIKKYLQDESIINALVQDILSDAIREYKLLLSQIMDEPMNVMLYKRKFELEDYFHSDDFRSMMNYALGLEEKMTDDMFESKATRLIDSIKEEVYFDEQQYPSPSRRIFGL